MMRRLRFCCEGAEISMEPKPKEQKIIREQTDPRPKSSEASVIPAKRKSVKTMMCNCVIHCICAKCYKAKAKKTLPPPTPNASNFKSTRNSVCSCSPPRPLYAAGNYGNETKGAFCKWQMK